MKNILVAIISICSTLTFTNCASDDNITELESKLISTTYTLNPVSDPAVIGDARMIKNEDASITIEIKLSGTLPGETYPTNLRVNTAAEGGTVAISLESLNGTTGRSTTRFTALDDGTEITYEDLLEFDGFIDVLLNNNSPAIVLAQGDIGQNELTGVSKTYTLGTRDIPEISGNAKFSERKNGEALARIELTNAIPGTEHPAHIHLNTALEGGAIAFTFNNINGDTGLSRTNVSALDDGTPFLYEDLIAFDGYVNAHLSASDDTVIAQGDIGINGLTGESVVYALNEVDVPEVQGTATFYKRESGEALAVLEIENTIAGDVHPAHIHANDINTTGAVVLTFNPVDGATGRSETNIIQLDDATPFGYDDVLQINGYINVHESTVNLGTIIAQGNIGVNVDN
ncbi:CHRD domain-containing protein [Bizionia hallyeonensis]|uniref:CHRD domain-containing protein n=1 Tax=Bizionia hallyeonensis TaxID=1123757 RepID=A0ABW0C7S0_9FLAO